MTERVSYAGIQSTFKQYNYNSWSARAKIQKLLLLSPFEFGALAHLVH